ncbi:MAG: hypothetical protein ACKOYK_12205 [Cyanobium sp.]
MLKDLNLMQSETERAGIATAVLPVLIDQVSLALQRGEGGLDVTAAFRYPISSNH